MFCVVNIHWDGGWIDSDDKKRFFKTYHTFSPEAERKFKSYWRQIATYFADRDQHLVFEGLNEESDFSGTGSEKKAYATSAVSTSCSSTPSARRAERMPSAC